MNKVIIIAGVSILKVDHEMFDMVSESLFMLKKGIHFFNGVNFKHLR